MFKAEIMLLTVCLFAGPTFAQDNPKAERDSDAVIKELRETLAKSQAALEASRAAEAKAREEAEGQRDRAQKLLYAAELERAQALEASSRYLSLVSSLPLLLVCRSSFCFWPRFSRFSFPWFWNCSWLCSF